MTVHNDCLNVHEFVGAALILLQKRIAAVVMKDAQLQSLIIIILEFCL
jgi:hypothetical protein